MREDLPKLMKDHSRIRYRAKYPKGRKRAELRIMDEDKPCRETSSSRWGQQGKEHRGISLKPLRRFLATQVGRPWDEVFSELCNRALMGGEDLVRQLRVWADFEVELNVQLIDGEPYDDKGFKISGSSWRALWVHPQTGILMEAPQGRGRYRYSGPRKTYEQKDLGNGRRAVKLKGIWYEVEFKPIPYAPAKVEDCPLDVIFGEKVVRRAGLRNENIGMFTREWDGVVYAARKLQMNSREIRRLTAIEVA